MFLIFANINTLVANDWPQWRGPNRDGKLTNFKAPESWPASLEKRWSIDVGDGTSVPLVQGNTVFMHSRNGEDEYVSALNLDSGTIIWQDHYPAMYNVTPEAREFGKGPFSTPVLHDNILITFGISEVLTAYDPASGKQYWRKTFSDEYKRSHAYYGTSFSPLVAGDMLIVHVGGPGNGALMALDPGTGDEKWRWSGDGPAYASPVVAEIQGVRQIVTKTQQKIIGVELESGKLLWEVPYKVSYDNTISEVLIWRNLALASDFQKHFRAYRLQKKDDGWAVDTAWENKEASLYMSSPILYGDIFIGFSDKKNIEMHMCKHLPYSMYLDLVSAETGSIDVCVRLSSEETGIENNRARCWNW